MKKDKINWNDFLAAVFMKRPKGAKGKASIKRDKKLMLEKARRGRRGE